MDGIEGSARAPVARRVSPRRVIGVVVAALVGAAAVLFVLGAWNPWQLVVLQRYFASPLAGLLLVSVGAYVALWLLAPVRNEAVQRGRIRARVTAAVFAVLGLLLWGILGQAFRADIAEIARSDDGTRALAAVTPHTEQRTYLRVWAGSGLSTREVGDLGRTCGPVTARFLAPDLIEVDTSYGTWRFTLDPATGTPRQVLGSRCPDGPVPATLGP